MESVNEGGEGGEGSKVKRESTLKRGWGRVELSRHPFYISHEIFFDVCTVQLIRYLKAAGWTLPKMGNSIFFFLPGVKSDCHQILSEVSICEHPENEF